MSTPKLKYNAISRLSRAELETNFIALQRAYAKLRDEYNEKMQKTGRSECIIY